VVLGEQAVLAGTPGADSRREGSGVGARCFAGGGPVNGGKELDAVGRGEVSDQVDDVGDPVGCGVVGVSFQPLPRLAVRAVDQHDRAEVEDLLGTVAVTAQVVPLQRLQDMIEVACVGAVAALGVVQPQRLACFLEEVHQLLDLQQRGPAPAHRRTFQPAQLGVLAEQRQQCGAAGGHAGTGRADRHVCRASLRHGPCIHHPSLGRSNPPIGRPEGGFQRAAVRQSRDRLGEALQHRKVEG
jgi:hypothetical protein